MAPRVYTLHQRLRRMLLRFSFFALLCALGFSATAQNATIRGQVTSAGEPAGFATVGLFQNDVFLKGSQTDEEGYYRFSGLDAGDYMVIVQYTGQADTALIFGLTSGQTKVEDIVVGETTTEVIEIIDKPDLIKSGEAGTSTSFGSEEVGAIQLSTDGSVTSVLEQVPGVNVVDGQAYVRGARPDAFPVFIDNIRITGSFALSQAGIGQVEVITGGTPPWFGDLTGGVIVITTKRPSSSSKFFVQAQSSYFTDWYNYNLGTISATGPLFWKKDSAGNKERPIVSYVAAVEFQYTGDDDPAIDGVYKLREGTLEDLQETPLIRSGENFVSRANFIDGDDFQRVKAKENGRSFNYRGFGRLDFNLTPNTILRVGAFADVLNNRAWSFTNSAFSPEANQQTNSQDYQAYARFQQSFIPKGKGLLKDVYYYIQGDYSRRTTESFDTRHGDNFFDYGHVGQFDNARAETYSLVNPGDANYNPAIGTSYWQTSGFIDTAFTFNAANSSNPLLANYNEIIYDYYAQNPRNLVDELGFLNAPFPPFSFDPIPTTNVINAQDLLNNGGILNGFNTTTGSSELNIYSLWTGMGSISNGYSQRQNETFRVTGQANLTLGKEGRSIHNIKIGFEFDQRINRLWYITPSNLWIYARNQTNRHLANLDTATANILYEPFGNTFLAHAEPLFSANDQSNFDRNLRESLGLDPNGNEFINVDGLLPSELKLSYFSADELYNNSTNGFGYYGYTYTGDLAGNTAEGAFFDDPINRPQDAFQPTYIAGYIHDKFELGRIFVNLGVRIDRFDANQQVLKDPFSLVPLFNAGEAAELLGTELPEVVGNDWVPYVDDKDNPTTIIGYRDGDIWYDADGTVTSPQRLQVNGEVQPFIREDSISLNAFEDYTPQVNVMPRISLSFPITDRANFFAHYDVLTQRPPSAGFLFYGQYLFLEQNATTAINNPALKPEKTVDYEVGFQQLLDAKGDLALSVSAYYREMRDMIQIVRRSNAYPITYDTFENLDFATVKGFTLQFFTRRLGIFQGRINYSLQFAEGTGSSFSSARGILGAVEGFSVIRTLLPLSFDQRHTIAGNINLRWTEQEKKPGPKIGKVYPLKDFGITLNFNLGSGTPYTRNAIPNQADVQFGVNSTTQVQGSPFGSRLPFNYRFDLRLDKDIFFRLGGAKDESGAKIGGRPASLNVYIVFLNLLNTRNVINVYQYTGLPDNAGFLETDLGQSVAESQVDPDAFVEQYRIKENNPNNFGQARRIRLGLAFTF